MPDYSTVELFLFMDPGQSSMIVKTLLAHDDNISTLQLIQDNSLL